MATLIQSLRQALDSKDLFLSNETQRIVLKSVLQAYVLNFLYNHRLYRHLNFYGGTCLYILYDLNRLSEDIDLDNSGEVDISNLGADLKAHFQKHMGYSKVTIAEQISAAGIYRVTLKFPVLYELGISPHHDEKLHLKVEISQHHQVSELKQTPVIYFGRSFVPSHFSLETMMAGKMLAGLERSFQKGTTVTTIKGRDFYDLLWLMQQRIWPLEEKLEQDGQVSYTTQTAMQALVEKVTAITTKDLEIDLLPLFEQRSFIEAWIESFHDNFQEYAKFYLDE
ncbi:MAG: hypothetical protein B6I38_06710 [Anaerolineaceae bacterium 4572_5.1]|nr:MAG: hypothetical protein B6I38_06710 [Anaerolineaceae bacterium 4572_5.1]